MACYFASLPNKCYKLALFFFNKASSLTFTSIRLPVENCFLCTIGGASVLRTHMQKCWPTENTFFPALSPNRSYIYSLPQQYLAYLFSPTPTASPESQLRLFLWNLLWSLYVYISYCSVQVRRKDQGKKR